MTQDAGSHWTPTCCLPDVDFCLQHCEKSMPVRLGHSSPSKTVSPHTCLLIRHLLCVGIVLSPGGGDPFS